MPSEAQSVTVQLQDAAHRPLTDDSGQPFPMMVDGVGLARALPGFDDPRYPYLRLVDPYGDTLFNGFQMAAVTPELERLAAATGSEAVTRVLEMARICASKADSYLVFFGD